MKMSLRWFGDDDKVTLENIKQIPGVSGIVTSLHNLAVGEAWPLGDIVSLKSKVENYGLRLETIESMPIHEDIKLGLPTRDLFIDKK